MGQEIVIKQLYIFADRTNYGQFVVACIASSYDEALELCEIKKNGWDLVPELTIPLTQDQESRVIFSGGGDNS